MKCVSTCSLFLGFLISVVLSDVNDNGFISEEINASSGSTISLSCTFRTTPEKKTKNSGKSAVMKAPYQILWKPINESENRILVQNNKLSSKKLPGGRSLRLHSYPKINPRYQNLVIRDIQNVHQGTYTCLHPELSNIGRKFHVTVKANKLSVIPSKTRLVDENAWRLECRPKDASPNTVTMWTKSKRKPRTSTEILKLGNSYTVMDSEVGKYTCIVDSFIGKPFRYTFNIDPPPTEKPQFNPLPVEGSGGIIQMDEPIKDKILPIDDSDRVIVSTQNPIPEGSGRGRFG